MLLERAACSAGQGETNCCGALCGAGRAGGLLGPRRAVATGRRWAPSATGAAGPNATTKSGRANLRGVGGIALIVEAVHAATLDAFAHQLLIARTCSSSSSATSVKASPVW